VTARLPGAPNLLPLVAVAHGSRDPRAAATVSGLLSAVRALSPGLDVRAAFLDHCAPSLPQVLGSVDGTSAVVVPLLLTAAYHSKTDIPAQLAAATAQLAAAGHPGLDVISAGTLGPHPLLLAALERRLREAGVPVDDADARAATSVVLAAAGSSDRAANARVAVLAAWWARERGWRAVVPACASAAGPRPAEVVAALRAETPRAQAHSAGTQRAEARGAGTQGAGAGPVVVATYLLAPGHFADKIRAASLDAGADAVSGVLGAAPEVADVVIDRYAAAVAGLAGSRPQGTVIDCRPAAAQVSG
jgi:sirohydrochlorin ferrochelatase